MFYIVGHTLTLITLTPFIEEKPGHAAKPPPFNQGKHWKDNGSGSLGLSENSNLSQETKDFSRVDEQYGTFLVLKSVRKRN